MTSDQAMDEIMQALTGWERRLVACPPFRGLRRRAVWDLRAGGVAHACPERPTLLRGLAGALLMLESTQSSAASLAFVSAQRDQVATVLEDFAAVLSGLPERGILLDGKASRHRAVLKQMRALRDALRESQLVPRAQAGRRLPGAPLHLDARALTLKTVQLMAADFRSFGPPTFSQEAIYRAVAAILEAFNVHSVQGKLFTAAGIKKLLTRHPPTPDMYGWDKRQDN